MKRTIQILTASLLFGFALIASAQSVNGNANSNTNQNNSASQSSSQSSAGSAANNQGNSLGVYNYGSPDTNFHGGYNINSQVPISVGTFGSFSQLNCTNGVSGAASTRWVSFGFGSGKGEVNCQHMVRSDAFGRAATLAISMHDMTTAAKLARANQYEICTADPQTQQMCLDLGLLVPGGRVNANVKVAEVKAPEPTSITEVIPSRPAGWTNAHWIQVNQRQNGLQSQSQSVTVQ